MTSLSAQNGQPASFIHNDRVCVTLHVTLENSVSGRDGKLGKLNTVGTEAFSRLGTSYCQSFSATYISLVSCLRRAYVTRLCRLAVLKLGYYNYRPIEVEIKNVGVGTDRSHALCF